MRDPSKVSTTKRKRRKPEEIKKILQAWMERDSRVKIAQSLNLPLHIVDHFVTYRYVSDEIIYTLRARYRKIPRIKRFAREHGFRDAKAFGAFLRYYAPEHLHTRSVGQERRNYDDDD